MEKEDNWLSGIQCFKCRKYGHKKEKCPEKDKKTEHPQVYQRLKWSFEDPMKHYFEERDRKQLEDKEERVKKLKELIEETSSDSSSDWNHRTQPKRKRSHSSDQKLSSADVGHHKRKKSKHKKVKRLKSDKSHSLREKETGHKSHKHKHKDSHRKHKSKHK